MIFLRNHGEVIAYSQPQNAKVIETFQSEQSSLCALTEACRNGGKFSVEMALGFLQQIVGREAKLNPYSVTSYLSQTWVGFLCLSEFSFAHL